MAAPDKLQAIRDAGAALVAAPDNFLAPSNDTSRQDYKIHNEQLATTARADENDILLGQASGSVAGMNDRSGASKSARDRVDARQQADKEKSLRSSEMLLLLNALQEGRLGEFIAGEIVGNMSDEDITILIADIEEATGKPFEAYAREILGDDMPEREEGESEVDYQRRVLKEVMAEMIGPDGKIKPEYQNDPIAKKLLENPDYKSLSQSMEELERKIESGEISIEEAKADIRDTVAESDVSALSANAALENDELVEVAQVSIQDKQTDQDIMRENTVESDGFFGAIGNEDTMKAASTEARLTFNDKASADGGAEPEPTDIQTALRSDPGFNQGL